MKKEANDWVFLDELPEEQREPLKKWLVGQTLPVPPGAGGRICCWRWDYDRWFAFWREGQKAPVFD